MEDEVSIDLRQYLDVLVRRWRIVMSLTLVAVIVAGLNALAFPPGYEAVAGIAIVRVKTDIEFDPRFKTLSGDLVGTGYAQAVGAEPRRSALIGLVENGAIARQVVDELGDQLEPGERNPSGLLRKVSAELVENGDLIQIKVTNADPARAAAIANSWAQAYERHVNDIYGGMPIDQSSSIRVELERVQQDYDQAQAALEAFIAHSRIDELNRLIEEKQHIISTLQAGKQTAITTLVDDEIKARTRVVSEYLDAQVTNELIAFQGEQEAKRSLLSAYIDNEIQNRITVLNRDQGIRSQIFISYVNAEVNGKLAVLGEQVLEKRQALSGYYATKMRTQRLLADAQTMRAQLVQGGDAAARSNQLALLLLKSQAFSSSVDLPSNLQLQLDTQSVSTVAQQLADLDGLIAALQQRLSALDADIDQLSRELLAGTGYNFLEDVSAADFTLSRFITAPLTSTQALTASLSTYIEARYRDLFEVGSLTEASQAMAADTSLFADIKRLYPDLFTLGELAQLAEAVLPDNPLATAADEKSQELLQLKEMESLPGYSAAAEPLTQAIDKLQSEIRTMQAELEQQQFTRQKLSQARDLAWDTYTTLARKQSEVAIAAGVPGSEVRFASPAVPPISRAGSRVASVSIAGMLGALLGVFAAFGIEYLGGGAMPQAVWGSPTAFWNRAFCWVMAEGAGLPYRPEKQSQRAE